MVEKVANAGLKIYMPELGEKKPFGEMEATLSYYGSHYFVSTPLELKGRGITLESVYTKENTVKFAWNKLGWKKYKVTPKAFEKLKETHAIVMESLLD